jgi:hypothetical protein
VYSCIVDSAVRMRMEIIRGNDLFKVFRRAVEVIRWAYVTTTSMTSVTGPMSMKYHRPPRPPGRGRKVCLQHNKCNNRTYVRSDFLGETIIPCSHQLLITWAVKGHRLSCLQVERKSKLLPYDGSLLSSVWRFYLLLWPELHGEKVPPGRGERIMVEPSSGW